MLAAQMFLLSHTLQISAR